MKCVKNAEVGTTDSNDCLVTVSPSETLEITVSSTVIKRYGEHIRALVADTLKTLDFEQGHVAIDDHGALDYCIKARVTTAVRRACEYICL